MIFSTKNNDIPSGRPFTYILTPFVIIPIMLCIATISLAAIIIVMVFLGMGVLYIISIPRHRNRSKFFFSWTLSSGLNMFLIFELIVMNYFEITYVENIIFLILFTFTCYSYHKMKSIADLELANGSAKGIEYSPVLTSDHHYCRICEIEVKEGYFHSIWLDCCVLKSNYVNYFMGHCFALATLLFGANLSLTTICQPYIFYGPILMPEDCGDVYSDTYRALCFVTCIYSLGYSLVVALVILHQFFVYISKYSASQWKKMAFTA